MAQTYYPFDSGAGANVTESQWSKMAQLWRDTGVIKLYNNELSVYADSTGMQAKVKTGAAWIKGHYFESDAEEVLAIGAANGTNPRIDRIVIRLDWSLNTIQLAVLQGTPAASPTAPALTQNTSRWEISLAQVRVNAGVSTIAAGNITDERYPSTLITPTLLNGWVTNSAGSAIYWKESGGMVHFQLALKSGGTGANTVIFNFPAGYIPDREILFVGYCEGTNVTDHTVIYHVTNSPAGELKLLRDIGAGNSLMILNGSFKAAN